MAHRIDIHPKAAKEFKKVGRQIVDQALDKLQERLDNPRVQADALHNMKDCYKIKLRSVGYRLVYQVQDDRVVILILALGKRDKSKVCEDAKKRLG